MPEAGWHTDGDFKSVSAVCFQIIHFNVSSAMRKSLHPELLGSVRDNDDNLQGLDV